MEIFPRNVLKHFFHKVYLRQILDTKKKKKVYDLLYFTNLMDATFAQGAFCELNVASAGCAGLRSRDTANSLWPSWVCCCYKTLRTLALSTSVNVLGNVGVCFRVKMRRAILVPTASLNGRESQSLTDGALR